MTPTNQEHSKYLEALTIVEGITNHGSLFSSKEEISPEDDEDLTSRINKDFTCLNGINYGAGR